MSDNKDLKAAKRNKKDEFYTSLEDIEKELKYYKEKFNNKIVFCNCDDPFESNFFKYFALNFNTLKLKKLICTCYAGSPIVYEQLSLLDVKPLKIKEVTPNKPYKIEINEVPDSNNDGAIDLTDVEYLLKNQENTLSLLKGDGDFRSKECINLLKQADIVVTNPPFSLFREYLNQLIECKKDFIIIGNVNAITNKEIFPLIMENKVWLGASIHSGDREFRVPDSYPLNASGCRIDENGNKYIRVKGVRWYTNLDYPQRHEDLILYKHYNENDYPKYDNYDAINVNVTAEIPCDYFGVMGVPLTFIDKYNPEQFQILGCTQRGCHDLVPDIKRYNDYWEVKQNGEKTGSSGSKTNENPNLKQNDKKHNYFINKEGEIVQSLYSRIFIKRINKGDNNNGN